MTFLNRELRELREFYWRVDCFWWGIIGIFVILRDEIVLDMALSKKGKALLNFLVFIGFTAVYGAVIALVNNRLRAYGIDKAYVMPLLIASTIYVYWKAWQWLCRKLDLLEQNKD